MAKLKYSGTWVLESGNYARLWNSDTETGGIHTGKTDRWPVIQFPLCAGRSTRIPITSSWNMAAVLRAWRARRWKTLGAMSGYYVGKYLVVNAEWSGISGV